MDAPNPRSPSPDSFPTPSQLLNDIAQAAPSAAAPPLPPQQRQQQQQQPRKQRNRLASLGFQATDPESISSHDRKRYYLECIESYSLYLQDRVRAAGFRPVPIQRVLPSDLHHPGVGPIRGTTNHATGTTLAHSTQASAAQSRVLGQDSKGLSIESIRTLLVHMESTARKLNEQTLIEEQQFAKLRAQYEALQATDNANLGDGDGDLNTRQTHQNSLDAFRTTNDNSDANGNGEASS